MRITFNLRKWYKDGVIILMRPSSARYDGRLHENVRFGAAKRYEDSAGNQSFVQFLKMKTVHAKITKRLRPNGFQLSFQIVYHFRFQKRYRSNRCGARV